MGTRHQRPPKWVSALVALRCRRPASLDLISRTFSGADAACCAACIGRRMPPRLGSWAAWAGIGRGSHVQASDHTATPDVIPLFPPRQPPQTDGGAGLNRHNRQHKSRVRAPECGHDRLCRLVAVPSTWRCLVCPIPATPHCIIGQHKAPSLGSRGVMSPDVIGVEAGRCGPLRSAFL